MSILVHSSGGGGSGYGSPQTFATNIAAGYNTGGAWQTLFNRDVPGLLRIFNFSLTIGNEGNIQTRILIDGSVYYSTPGVSQGITISNAIKRPDYANYDSWYSMFQQGALSSDGIQFMDVPYSTIAFQVNGLALGTGYIRACWCNSQ